MAAAFTDILLLTAVKEPWQIWQPQSLVQVDGGERPPGKELPWQVFQQRWGQGKGLCKTLRDGGKMILQGFGNESDSLEIQMDI